MIDYQASFTNTDGVAFPDTAAVNVSAPGAGDGTEFVALMVNDIWGRAQALLDYAGLTPDGVTEAPDTAQVLEAIGKGFGVGPGVGVTYWKNDTPAVWGDRVLLLQGQEISQSTYALLFAAVYCGDANNATAPAFYSTNGAGVRTLPGAGGTHFVLPDARGLSLKNIGNATISTRTKTGPVSLGEAQEDQLQNITGLVENVWASAGTVSGAFSTVAGGNTRAGAAATATSTLNFSAATSAGARTGIHTRDSALGTNFGITY